MEHTKWHQLSDEELRNTLGVSPQEGLTDEAVAEKRKVVGSNEPERGETHFSNYIALESVQGFYGAGIDGSNVGIRIVG